MSIKWSLKSYLVRKHQIYTATSLQKIVATKTGVTISLAQTCNLVNRTPKAIKLETLEILCTALNCEAGSFLSVSPRKIKRIKRKKLSYKNTPKSKTGSKSFPLPEDYEN